MKKILFFIHNGWVFGKIHNELIKVLYPDVYCDILSWESVYSTKEINLLLSKYDYILSTPQGCFFLHEHYQIPIEKTIGIVHGDIDIYTPIKLGKLDLFGKLGGYAVISPVLQTISFTYGIERIPTFLPIGVFQNNYKRNENKLLTTIGHFGLSTRTDPGFDIKRGALIEEIAKQSNTQLIHCIDVNFLCVEPLYNTVGLVIFASLVEGNPYPMLEAFASGIPVLGTHCGIAPNYLQYGGGVILPFDPDLFVSSAIEEINRLKIDEEYYTKLSNESYNIGTMIDWSNLKTNWINFFNNLP